MNMKCASTYAAWPTGDSIGMTSPTLCAWTEIEPVTDSDCPGCRIIDQFVLALATVLVGAAFDETDAVHVPVGPTAQAELPMSAPGMTNADVHRFSKDSLVLLVDWVT
jgi:hypothetical protein